MIAEYSAAGHVSRGAMEFAFDDARMLHTAFPDVLRAHERGLITPAHVREILRESQPVRDAVSAGEVDAATLDLYAAAALEVAEHDTPARTRAHARQVAAALAGLTVVEQHQRATADRTVTVRSIGDGLALLQAVLPEHLAVGILDRLTAMARHLTRPGDTRMPVLPATDLSDAEWEELRAWEEWTDSREQATPDQGSVSARGEAIFSSETFATDPFPSPSAQWVEDEDPSPFGSPPEPDLSTDPRQNPDSPLVYRVPDDLRTVDQVRADLLTDLLLASTPSDAHGTGLDSIHATIQVTVAATTLADIDNRPAQLDGHGPLHPDVARRLAAARTGWSRLFLDATGMLTATDTYTPTEPMRRHLRARDQHCRFPGCRQPVHRCDIDHHHDHALGGPTAIDNLAHFCRAHHMLKHPDIPDAHRWHARQQPDRSVEWTSPNGRSYPDPPRRRVMFVASSAPHGEAPAPF